MKEGAGFLLVSIKYKESGRMKCQNLKMIALIWSLTVSCSSLDSSPNLSSTSIAKSESSELVHISGEPKIPFAREDAFYPLRVRGDGEILPSYQWKECVKRFIVCTRWEKRTVFFEDLSWFKAAGFGLSKRDRP